MQAAQPGAALTIEQAAAAAKGWKALMPVGGRPFLDYVLDALAEASCRDAGIVIGPEQRDDFERWRNDARGRFTKNVKRPLASFRVTLIEQARAEGTADAVRSARPWIGDAPFLVVNGDNLYPVEALRALAALDGPGAALFERDALVAAGNIPAARVAAFAVAELDAAGDITRLVEKPAAVALEAAKRPVLVSMNAWRFDHRILAACRDVGRSPRGEYELPAAVELAISRGVRVKAIVARGPVLDLSQRLDVLEVGRWLSAGGARP
jgi:glucose-1-phosphate thymidylyltransferase